MDCLPHLHIAAYHAEVGHRSATPGLGVLCREKDLLLGAGVLQNSIGRQSSYATVGWQPWALGPARVGAFAGVIDGYAYRQGNPFGYGGALVSLPWRGVGELHAAVIPRVSGVSPLTVAFSISLRFAP